MTSLKELLKQLKHIMSQTTLGGVTLGGYAFKDFVDYMLTEVEECEHVWESVPNGKDNPYLYYDTKEDGHYTELRCTKCFYKSRLYWEKVRIQLLG